MHTKILITGRPGTGKSTLALWLVKRLGRPWAGYRTLCAGRCEAGPLFSLYACPGGESAPISRWEQGAIRPVPESFEGLGAACLKNALEGPAPVVLLDEIGRFEKDCPAFLGRVEELLGSEKIVVAVLKQEPLPYLDRWRALPGALLLDLDRISPPQAREVLEQELPPLHWGLTLRLYGQEKSFGPGPLRLLEGVERTGSLHRAAAEMGMAYSKAWKLLQKVEAEWGFPVLESRPGGAGGGGSALTARGRELAGRYRRMLEAVEAAACQAFEEAFGDFGPGEGPGPDRNL